MRKQNAVGAGARVGVGKQGKTEKKMMKKIEKVKTERKKMMVPKLRKLDRNYMKDMEKAERKKLKALKQGKFDRNCLKDMDLGKAERKNTKEMEEKIGKARTKNKMK